MMVWPKRREYDRMEPCTLIQAASKWHVQNVKPLAQATVRP